MKTYLILVARILFGLALIGFCGDAFHDEIVRPEHSLILLAALGAGIIFGALIVPGLNTAVEDGGQRGFKLFSLGRRAYDNVPPKVDP